MPDRRRPYRPFPPLMLCCLLGLGPLLASTVEDVVRGAYRSEASDPHYHIPDQQEQHRFNAAFGLLLRDPGLLGVANRNLEPLGFVAKERELGGRRYLVVQETPPGNGGGIYLIDPEPRLPNLIIQAPHARNDIDSERIAARWFVALGARALCASTISRFTLEPSGIAKYGPADVCHDSRSYWQAATDALTAAKATPPGILLQIHGYAAEKHPELAAVAAVLSGGRDRPGALITGLETAWEGRLGAGSIAVYGTEADELGATLNHQGRLLHDRLTWGFVHLELAAETRAALMADPSGDAAWLEPLRDALD